MAQDISLWGATYPGVPGILLPKSGSGTALFCDPSVTTATAADVAAGKLFLTAAGVITQGTASGGGGGGLEYESGTYTPTSDIAAPTISFSKVHTEAPIYFAIVDVSGASSITANSNLFVGYFDCYKMFGAGYPYSTNAYRYALMNYVYKSSSSTSSGVTQIQYSSDETEDSGTAYARYWATESGFKADGRSTTRYWRRGRTYKWIAIWKPTT